MILRIIGIMSAGGVRRKSLYHIKGNINISAKLD
jgi:hypothetical protein